MEFRSATQDDAEAIKLVANRSLRESYTDVFDEETIEAAVEQWYAPSTVQTLLDAPDSRVYVAETDDDLVGFSQCELLDEGESVGLVRWLHVTPDARGDGVGTRLLVRTRETLVEDEGVERLQGTVLEANAVGNEFYDSHGFERVGTRTVEVGGNSYTENVYANTSEAGDWSSAEARTLADGTEVDVSFGEAERGSEGPFYAAYRSTDREERYGWFCGVCDSVDNAMDTMGRIECNECGNSRRPSRWDASYL